jgi:hypothetical protein
VSDSTPFCGVTTAAANQFYQANGFRRFQGFRKSY